MNYNVKQKLSQNVKKNTTKMQKLIRYATIDNEIEY